MDLLTTMTESCRVERLTPPDLAAGAVDAVLDTDTYNEIDDQFALAYALLSPERIRLHAVYAAPFVNDRSANPAEGMAKSHDEIYELFRRMGRDSACPVFRGSEQWMDQAGGTEYPIDSNASRDIIERAMARPVDDSPLYVVAIGAPTNVSSAIVSCPEICNRIVVVWLGGTPASLPTAAEFNLGQDISASHVLLDSGVPLVRVPTTNVAQKLRTTVSELRQFIAGHNPLCDFLLERFTAYETFETPKKQQVNAGRPIAYAKEIWDLANIAWLIDPSWAPSALVPGPLLTDNLTWGHDAKRHLTRELHDLNRDAVFGDLFTKFVIAQRPA